MELFLHRLYYAIDLKLPQAILLVSHPPLYPPNTQIINSYPPQMTTLYGGRNPGLKRMLGLQHTLHCEHFILFYFFMSSFYIYIFFIFIYFHIYIIFIDKQIREITLQSELLRKTLSS